MIRVEEREMERLVKTENAKLTAYQTTDGFVLTGNDAVLITARGTIRLFARLDSIHSLVKDWGTTHYAVSTEVIEF